MTLTSHDSYALASTSWSFGWLRRLYSAILTARQNQADVRTSSYLRTMPADVLLKLGASAAELKRFRGVARLPTTDGFK
jgi:hypothetical protein